MRWFPRLFYWADCLRYRIARRPVTVGVRLLLLREGEILLVQHTYQRHWYLPGGKVERGETLEQAARREADEELGATLGALRLFGVYTNFYEGRSDHVVVFLCDDLTLTGETDREIERFAWFPLGQLPEGVSPGSRHRIAEYAHWDGKAVAGLW